MISVLIPIIGFGQRIGFDEIDNSKVAPWIVELSSEYQCVYHFGDSEMESDFILIIENDRCCAQIKNGNWTLDGKKWIIHYENLINVRIEGNLFFSDKTNGEFVLYDNGKEKIKGLKVFNSWSGLTQNGEYEIGTKSYPVADYFSGKFIQASLRQLNSEELRKMSKSDLKLMRNEIYARYGFIFKSGGEMELYFKKQEWYLALYNNVDNFLTEIEKENIKLIQKLESK
ncbi:MAG: YARHG domain-containing protein [Flavobacteriia bacterium]|nr:YARHG domain-containing protein [Flavobacteriia bacterium]